MEPPTRVLDAFRAVDALPFSPRPVSARVLWARAKTAADMVAHNIPATERFLVAVNPYPPPFSLVDVPVDGGALQGWISPARPGAPGLLLTPGTFHTKDDTMRKAKALRVWRAWGWNVLACDLRGFGGSHALAGSGGLLEADDVLAAARFLREATGCGPVAVLGESLGGASALVAAADPRADGLVSAVSAWSPFADLAEVVRYVTAEDAADNPTLAITRRAYRVMVWARSRGRFRGFEEVLAHAAEAAGLGVDELLRRASPVRHVARVRVPALVVHAEDDPIVPVRHAHALREAARGNPWVHVRVVPAGAHLFFDAVDPAWYWRALETFLRGVVEPPEARA